MLMGKAVDKKHSYIIPYFNYQLHAQFLYSLTICMLHYNLRHVSSININMPSSGGQIVLSQHLVSSLSVQYSTVCRMRADSAEQSALIRHTVQPFTESDDTRCCDNEIRPPEDGHVDARNMLRIVM